MTLEKLTDLCFTEWLHSKKRPTPKLDPSLQELEKYIQALPLKWDEYNDLSTLAGNCAAAYEEYGFRQGFRAAGEILGLVLDAGRR